MTNRKYLKIMHRLGERLELVADTEPFDDDAFHEVTNAIVNTNRIWWHRRQRRRLSLALLCWVLFCILVGYVIYILAVP